MPTKRTPIKETKARYHAQHKSSRGVRAQITLEWADVDRAATPIVLERDGQPAAVVMRYADYQQWGARHPAPSPQTNDSNWESQLAVMAADPEIQRELHRIEEEFAHTEMDGLEALR